MYHEISQDRIDLLMQQMQEVSDYAQGMADHFFYYQDEPFYKAFVNGATEYLSRINLAEYKTRDIMTYEYVEGGLEINSDPGLGFSDFLGEWAVAEVESGMSGADIAGITAAGAHMMLGHEQTAAVLLRGSDADHGMVRFAMYFEEQYRALEEAGVFEASDIVELTDYLDALAVQGEFEHSMDKPMLEFLNGMLDMLILPPLIEAMTGEELLTGEDLSGGQRIMKAVGAAMDIASIGQASLANGILKTGGRQALGILGKAATVEIGSNLAAYGTVSLGEALDLPVAVTIALGIGVGGGTHVKLSKVMFGDMDSAAVRAFSMTDADEEVTALRYTDEAAEAGRGVSYVGGSEGDTSTVKKVFTDNPFDEAGNLKPNIKYQTGEFKYNYETDANGRISNWNTDNLQLTERDGRLNYQSDTPGKIEGDHAGHLAGDRFGGSPKLDNIVSQSQNVNLSQYKKIENQWAKAINEGKEVTVNVDVKYDGDGLRPIEFNVEYTIDDDFFSQSILN